MTETARIQYVFLDVVKFTQDRSVEAQSDVIAKLNEVVIASLKLLHVTEDTTVLLPTGDGMAIALIEISGVDTHLRLALRILAGVAEHNATSENTMRKFDVRIGINENTDNIVTDVTGRRNVAGAGISMAQRIMDQADGGQVLVGSIVYESLRQREQYMTSWRAFTAHGKHGITFPVYQFVSKHAMGLNADTPSAFAPRIRTPKNLSQKQAYYLATAIANRDFLTSKKGDPTREYTATILMWLRAEDAIEAANASPHERPTVRTWKGGQASFAEQYDHYDEMDFWPAALFTRLIHDRYLGEIDDLFERSEYAPLYWLVSERGVRRLVAEWPAVANEFGIADNSAGQSIAANPPS